MAKRDRFLFVVAVAIFLAGVGRAAAGDSGGSAAPSAAPTLPPAVTAPLRQPPGSAALAAELITPTDMGGNYRAEAAGGSAFVASAACLGILEPSVGQGGRAATALRNVTDAHTVPYIVEVVTTYASTAPVVYRSLTAAVRSCRTLTFSFGGSEVAATLHALHPAPVGQAITGWEGTFAYGGTAFVVDLGVVLYGQAVITLAWIDTASRSPAIMGDFPSTVSLAIGKLA